MSAGRKAAPQVALAIALVAMIVAFACGGPQKPDHSVDKRKPSADSSKLRSPSTAMGSVSQTSTVSTANLDEARFGGVRQVGS